MVTLINRPVEVFSRHRLQNAMHTGCFGAVDFVDPSSGSVLADFEGTLNAATIQCNISGTQGTQITTQWELQNFRGNPMDVSIINAPAGLFGFSGFYDNRLTILNLTSELDKVTVFCGTGWEPKGANFTLRIYSKCINIILPVLEDHCIKYI